MGARRPPWFSLVPFTRLAIWDGLVHMLGKNALARAASTVLGSDTVKDAASMLYRRNLVIKRTFFKDLWASWMVLKLLCWQSTSFYTWGHSQKEKQAKSTLDPVCWACTTDVSGLLEVQKPAEISQVAESRQVVLAAGMGQGVNNWEIFGSLFTFWHGWKWLIFRYSWCS